MSSSLSIASDRIAVISHPEHGFHITSVVDRSDGTELLWQRGFASPRALGGDLGPAGGPSVDSFDQDLLLGGWFLMFPSVGVPGPADGDHWMHGEAPRLPWQRREHTVNRVRCSLRTPSGFEVVRELNVRGPTLTVDTSIRNLTTEPLTWAMGEHPCFSRSALAGGVISEGDKSSGWHIGVPSTADARQRHTMLSTGSGSIQFALPGRRAKLRVDPAFYPSLLVWEDYAGGSGRDVVAVEPATVPGRTTAEHTEAAAWRELKPGQSVQTAVQLTLL
jgi:hypothetical protein